jgi:hypothetical protein
MINISVKEFKIKIEKKLVTVLVLITTFELQQQLHQKQSILKMIKLKTFLIMKF